MERDNDFNVEDRTHLCTQTCRERSLNMLNIYALSLYIGPQGLAGEPGAIGPIGPPGAQGEKGPRGKRGKRVSYMMLITNTEYEKYFYCFMKKKTDHQIRRYSISQSQINIQCVCVCGERSFFNSSKINESSKKIYICT